MSKRSRTRLEALQDSCASAPEPFYVSTYSPGDGVTRYRFSNEPGDYFGVRADFTALGAGKLSPTLVAVGRWSE